MPLIEHILGEGPEMTESQAKVLEVMEKHPDYLFRLDGDDLREIQRWITAPEADVPLVEWDKSRKSSLETIRWSVKTLHGRKNICSIVIEQETYYGSHQAVRQAEDRVHKNEGGVTKVTYYGTDAEGNRNLLYEIPVGPNAGRR